MKNLLITLMLVLVSTISFAKETPSKETKSLEEILHPLVEKAVNGMDEAGEFIMEQVPELIQEFYAWHTALAIVGIIIGSILTIIGISCLVIESRVYHWEGLFVGMFGGVFPLIGGMVMLGANIYQYLFITIAPKLYLIEYFF